MPFSSEGNRTRRASPPSLYLQRKRMRVLKEYFTQNVLFLVQSGLEWHDGEYMKSFLGELSL